MDEPAGTEVAEARTESLRLIPSLGPEITLFLSMLEALRARTKETVAGMSEEDLMWAPAPGIRSVAAMLRHLAGTELYWIRECFGGVPAPEDLWRACGWSIEPRGEVGRQPERSGAGMSREAGGNKEVGSSVPPPNELPLEPAPLAAWLATLDRVRHESVRMLEMTRDAALDSDYVHPLQEKRVCQGRWILYHVLEHEAYHRGQMAALRGQLKRGARMRALARRRSDLPATGKDEQGSD